MTVRVIELWDSKESRGTYCALIDAKHWRRVKKYRWRVHFSAGRGKKPGAPYARACVDGRYVYLHRFVTNAPERMHVDHLNHQTLDCRDRNLEVVDNLTNQRRKRNRKK